jgi:hypothetical protein
MNMKMFGIGLFVGCIFTSLFFVCGLPCVLQQWHQYMKPGEEAHPIVTSSRTPLKVQTLETFAFLLDGNLSGDISGVAVRRDGPLATLCIVVCVQRKKIAEEHQFIVSDLQFKQKEDNGDLLFVRTPQELNVQ